jgi:hypothetical protein
LAEAVDWGSSVGYVDRGGGVRRPDSFHGELAGSGYKLSTDDFGNGHWTEWNRAAAYG